MLRRAAFLALLGSTVGNLSIFVQTRCDDTRRMCSAGTTSSISGYLWVSDSNALPGRCDVHFGDGSMQTLSLRDININLETRSAPILHRCVDDLVASAVSCPLVHQGTRAHVPARAASSSHSASLFAGMGSVGRITSVAAVAQLA